MKIKTITCHDVYNYGASLQAYAMQMYLKHKGHNVEIIDYLPNYMDKAYRLGFKRFMIIPKPSPLYKYRNIFFFQLIYGIKKYIPHLMTILRQQGRKKAFDHFKSQYLTCTLKYTTYAQLQVAQISADTLIVGSDQVWNPLFNNGRDASFFLQFGLPSIKRIAYAASFGVSTLSETDATQIKTWLQSFNAISVRETTGLKLLKQMQIETGVQVVDPIFLLSGDEWHVLASTKKSKHKDYILIYNLGTMSDSIKQCAQSLAQKHHLLIISIEDSNKMSYADIIIADAGPIEFVQLIKEAKFVVTNSFHATAFSLKLNVPFFVFIQNATSSRVSDVLGLVNLKERLNATSFETIPDWKQVNELLDKYISSSKAFIDSNL